MKTKSNRRVRKMKQKRIQECAPEKAELLGTTAADGRRRLEFFDRLGRECSIEEGFPTNEPTLMVGAATDPKVAGVLSRMDLSKEMAAMLAPVLAEFGRTGKCPLPIVPYPNDHCTLSEQSIAA